MAAEALQKEQEAARAAAAKVKAERDARKKELRLKRKSIREFFLKEASISNDDVTFFCEFAQEGTLNKAILEIEREGSVTAFKELLQCLQLEKESRDALQAEASNNNRAELLKKFSKQDRRTDMIQQRPWSEDEVSMLAKVMVVLYFRTLNLTISALSNPKRRLMCFPPLRLKALSLMSIFSPNTCGYLWVFVFLTLFLSPFICRLLGNSPLVHKIGGARLLTLLHSNLGCRNLEQRRSALQNLRKLAKLPCQKQNKLVVRGMVGLWMAKLIHGRVSNRRS